MSAMIKLRQFQSEDLNALYAISLATGHEGGDASYLYRDANLMGHIYSAPYALLEPDLVLVVIDGDGVAGFALGAIDTLSWEDVLEQDWWPALRREYPDPEEASSATWTIDQRRASTIHHPKRTPPDVADVYPTHLHLNLLSRVQGHGIGSILLKAWLDLAAKRGAAAVHVGVNSANQRALRFWSQNSFRNLKTEERAGSRTVWMGRS
jgi:GNAT superfamily N-acetyltransferase